MFRLDEEEIDFYKESADAFNVKRSEILEILNSAETGNEIEMSDISKLLAIDPSRDEDLFHKLLESGDRVRDKCLGNYVNIVAPLYVSNFCVESCEYCGYSINNKTSHDRHRLDEEQLRTELSYLIGNNNYQSIELVFANDPKFDALSIGKYVEVAKNFKSNGNQAWMVGVNCQPFDEKDYRIFKDHGTDIVLSWQETYHKNTYDKVHGNIHLKGDFDYRLQTQDRVYNGGVKESGMGVLFGLYDYNFETLSLIKHARFLRKTHNKNPLIGIPRLKAAGKFQVPLCSSIYPSDDKLRQLVAVIRLSVPYSHIFISTREKEELITSLLQAGGGGVTSSLCSVSPGGYVVSKNTQAQFEVNSYEPEDMMKHLREINHIPSYSPPVFEQIKLEDLTRSIIEGDVVVFVGAGFSSVANKGNLPLGKDLTESMAQELRNSGTKIESLQDLPHVALAYENKFGREKLEETVKRFTDRGGPTDLHRALADILSIKEFISINYDTCLEDTLRLRRGDINLVETDADMLSSESETTVYKIHGSHSKDGNPLVITYKDFIAYYKKNEIVYQKLQELFFTKKMLFLGCSIQDTNIKDLITLVDEITGKALDEENRGFRYYAVARNSIALGEILKNNGLYVFNTDIKYFIDLLIDRLRLDYVNGEITYEKLWEIRAKLEVSAAASAAKNRDAEDIYALKNALGKFQRELESEEMVSNDVLWKYDYEFHLAISKASKNIIFYDISKTIYKALKPISSKVQSFGTLKEHKRVYDAICNRDEISAAKYMRSHINSVKDKSKFDES